MNDLSNPDDKFFAMLAKFEAAADKDAGAGDANPRLKFKKGGWVGAGDTPIPPDKEYVALVPAAEKGFCRWESSKLIDRRMRSFGEPEILRHEVGDVDERMWAVGRDGQAIDPWSPQTVEMPLIERDSGEKFDFAISSGGGRRAAGKLVKDFTRHCAVARRLELPVVLLSADRYRHELYGWVDFPVFTVTGWIDGTGLVELPEPEPEPDLGGALEDEIPF